MNAAKFENILFSIIAFLRVTISICTKKTVALYDLLLISTTSTVYVNKCHWIFITSFIASTSILQTVSANSYNINEHTKSTHSKSIASGANWECRSFENATWRCRLGSTGPFNETIESVKSYRKKDANQPNSNMSLSLKPSEQDGTHITGSNNMKSTVAHKSDAVRSKEILQSTFHHLLENTNKYTVLWYSGDNKQMANSFKNLAYTNITLMIVTSETNGRPWYKVISGVFNNKKDADLILEGKEYAKMETYLRPTLLSISEISDSQLVN